MGEERTKTMNKCKKCNQINAMLTEPGVQVKNGIRYIVRKCRNCGHTDRERI